MKSKKWILLFLLVLLLLLFVCIIICFGGSHNSEDEAVDPKNENTVLQDVSTAQLVTPDASPITASESVVEEPVFPSAELPSYSTSPSPDYPDFSSEAKTSPVSSPVPDSISGENILPEMPLD